MNDVLRHKIRMLPDSPGCYMMKSGGEIIYVGKAVNLKNRVRSYFRGEHTPKVAAMVARVEDFDIVLCRTNFEALTLECNLIKKYRPFYNILLKDDKHYPYLRVDPREPFPRLTLARRMDLHDGAKYFGPYIGATAVRQVVEEIRKYFPLRTCSMALPVKAPRRPCVHYQIGRCKAPCAKLITEEEYAEMMKGVIAFLNGDTSGLIRDLTAEMNAAAASLRYEEAARVRDKIRDIRQFSESQHAIQTREVEQDIMAFSADESDAMVYLGHVREGRMEEGRAFLFEGAGGEAGEDILSGFLTQYYDDEHLIPRQVLAQTLPEPVSELENWLREKKGAAVTLSVPQRGEKHVLVQIAEKNAQDALLKYRTRREVKDLRTRQALLALRDALHLPDAPRRIEGFDISNTSGELSVGAMVVFEDGEPLKKAYRIFRIRTVEGPNDFASIGEVVSRRLTHGLKEREERLGKGLDPDGGSFSKLPDLILIDGGPEQLAYARNAMKEAGLSIPMIGLAERLEDIYLPDEPLPVPMDKRSPAQHLLQFVRDEAHRFGITHHRELRGKEQLRSSLAEVPGIGPKKQVALIRRFGSVGGVFAASWEELEQVPGISARLAEAILARGEAKRQQ